MCNSLGIVVQYDLHIFKAAETPQSEFFPIVPPSCLPFPVVALVGIQTCRPANMLGQTSASKRLSKQFSIHSCWPPALSPAWPPPSSTFVYSYESNLICLVSCDGRGVSGELVQHGFQEDDHMTTAAPACNSHLLGAIEVLGMRFGSPNSKVAACQHKASQTSATSNMCHGQNSSHGLWPWLP